MTEVRRAEGLLVAAGETPGFLPIDEALALYAVGRRALRRESGVLIEIGSYLGRSALFLAAAIAAEKRGVLFSIDHHRGSEELQAGWPDHDPSLIDRTSGRIDSLPRFRRAISEAAAEDLVIAVVGNSATVASHWATPAALVFIDGGHGEQPCWDDYRGWSPHVTPGGFLVFHDVFPDPALGGRPPFECFEDALASGLFLEDEAAGCGSLRVLVRVAQESGKKSLADGPPQQTSRARRTADAE
jgi:MMP 1-O-methyltransferase